MEQAVTRGEYVRPDERLLAVLTAIGVLLGLVLVVIVGAVG